MHSISFNPTDGIRIVKINDNRVDLICEFCNKHVWLQDNDGNLGTFIDEVSKDHIRRFHQVKLTDENR